MSDSDFSSFDDALEKLELEEDDLKRLISAGEIRAFKEGSRMRLRVEDVERVADELGIGGAVSEDDAGEVLEVEDLMLDDDGDDDAGMVTTQLSEEDTLLDDDVDVVEVEDEGSAAPVARTGRAGRSGRAAGGRTRRGKEEEQQAAESGGMRAALVLTALVLVFAIPFAIGMISGVKTGVTSGVVDIFAGE